VHESHISGVESEECHEHLASLGGIQVLVGQLDWAALFVGVSPWILGVVPSGKHTKNYGKSPFFMGKLTINGHFQ